MSLAVRADAEELMDADDLAPATYAAVVGDLARVNTVTLAARPTLDFLERAVEGRTRLRILDVGFGDGDMLRRIAHWAGVHAPATTPPAILDKLAATIDAAMKMPDVADKLKAVGIEPVGGTRASFAKFIDEEHARLSSVVKATGMKAE